MMRKSTLVFIIVISGLMFYAGCDDNDGGGGQAAPTPTPTGSPPPGGGVPPPEACNNCPCDYFNVPMTAGCWVSPTFDPGDPEISGERCSLFPSDLGFGQGLVVFSGIEFACPESERCCRIIGLDSDTCDAPDETVERLNDDQVGACQACVEEYATALNGSVMLTNEPPYMCATHTPPPGGGVPPPDEVAEACMKCPCKYYDVPMTDKCWLPGTHKPRFNVTISEGGLIECLLRTLGGVFPGTDLFLSLPGSVSTGSGSDCAIEIDSSTPDCGTEIDHKFTQQDFIDEAPLNCKICYDRYLTDLNTAIGVDLGTSPHSYSCSLD
jgi:hypothetical protein